MTDVLSVGQRSRNMQAIKAKNTKPEIAVRRIAHSLGYRYQLHRRDLPGSPDLVFPSSRRIIFVHGCFWHCHKSCSRAYVPQSNMDYWLPKLARNVQRDKEAVRTLKASGWQILVIWECSTGDTDRLQRKIEQFLNVP